MSQPDATQLSWRNIVTIIAIAVTAIALMAGIVVFALGGPGALLGKESSEQPEKLTTYRTHLYEQLDLPGPAFVFDYPENWKIDAECNPNSFSETINLETDTGKHVHFAFGAAIGTTGGGPTDEQLAKADFNAEAYPGLEQPESCEDYWWKNHWDRSSDGEIAELSLSVNRWERTVPQLGLREGYMLVDAAHPGNVFWYYGGVQCLCMDEPGSFTEDEEREIVQVLASLRQEPAQKAPVS